MIQVEVTMIPVDANAQLSLDYQAPFLNQNCDKISDFFQSCVDQSLILNLHVMHNLQDELKHITLYFSTNMENAQEFARKFQDLTVDFSMKKFWNQAGFDTSFSFEEINFDSIQVEATELVNRELSEIWGVVFPIET